jgi:hypothetical protein
MDTKPSPTTIEIHNRAVQRITDATTTRDLAEALAEWQDISEDGRAPGVDMTGDDGRYFNGYHFLSKFGTEVAATDIHSLPLATNELWAKLHQEQREQAERGPGRPAIGERIAVRFPAWRQHLLEKNADELDVKTPELIRWLVGEAYARLDADARAAGVSRIDLIRQRMAERP